MQDINRTNETLGQFCRVEHDRLHRAEQWPDGPYKQAVLAAARAALERLESTAVEPFRRPTCMVCDARKPSARVLMFPSRTKGSAADLRPAA